MSQQIVAREQASGAGAGAVVATVGCSVLGFMVAGGQLASGGFMYLSTGNNQNFRTVLKCHTVIKSDAICIDLYFLIF